MPEEPAVVATISIEMTAAGQVKVSGAIDNKLMAYGLLELAKESIVNYHAQQEKRIVTPPPGFAIHLGGKKD